MVLTLQKTVEVPKLQFIVMPVVVQQQVPMVVTSGTHRANCAEARGDPQVQFLVKVVDMFFVVQQQVPRSPWRIFRCSSWLRLLTRPLLCNDRCRRSKLCREVPQWPRGKIHFFNR